MTLEWSLSSPELDRGSAPNAGSLPKPPHLHHFFEASADRSPEAVAVASERESLTYAELEQRANRLARYLRHAGAFRDRTVGLFLGRSPSMYTALLATLKAGAGYVPLDTSWPPDRLKFIASDAGLKLVITDTEHATSLPDVPCPVVCLDSISTDLTSLPPTRLAFEGSPSDLAYIIYTSGTTGRPKGVAVEHDSVCHLISVCAPIYGVTSRDRVYQGMPLAFDFSIEEVWSTFVAGATLVAGTDGERRVGPGLHELLAEQEVTVFACVPTLLATLDDDLPAVRTLLVGGEACPPNLVERWSRPERRMLNTYGPTETCVTASWCELTPDRPVTIGKPMPGYSLHILDETMRRVPEGEAGEIYIGGPGVARGYVNRSDLTASAFIPDPFDASRSGARLYRSGDLGRLTPQGEIEYLGRIDGQVKLRGYRLELGEIESLASRDRAVAAAVASVYPADDPQDIVLHVVLRNGDEFAGVRERLRADLRAHLPAYMVPAYIEPIDVVPTMPSGKVDRKRLPEPRLGRAIAVSAEVAHPATHLESRLAEVWREVFGRDDVSVEADFFSDLGGHSLFAARAVSAARSLPELHSVGIRDIYAFPTIRGLAAHLDEDAADQTEPADEVRREAQRYTSLRVWMTGGAQVALLYVLLALTGSPFALIIASHMTAGSAVYSIKSSDVELFLLFVMLSFVLPPVVKWTVIGRYRPGSHELWGWYFIRWWIVGRALALSPAALLTGTPLYPAYLRLLGARVGKGCTISSALVLLPDLVDIGDNVSIGYDAEVHPYIVEDGMLRMAPIEIGDDAFLGTRSVTMLGAEVGAGARVAEQTVVARGQRIPAGESWAGSPSRKMERSDPLLELMESRTRPAARVAPWLLAAFVLAFVLLEFLAVALVLPGIAIAMAAFAHGSWWWALGSAPLAALAFVLSISLAVLIGKRLVMPRAHPGVYSMRSFFGLRKWMADKLMEMSLALTNSMYATLYVVPWLRALGARIGPRSEVSTVSRFNPDLLTLGPETFVADIASVGASTFHNGHVALAPTSIGRRTFIGNAAVVPGNAVLPDNCLIGVQSVVPERAESGTSWLGSPAIFLPRRQVYEGFDESVTYRPPARLVAYRLFVEAFRILLPPTLLYVDAVLGSWLCSLYMASGGRPAGLVALMPLAFMPGTLLVVLFVAVLKWALVGRYRPRVEPLWAPFVRHSELITGLYETVTVPLLGGMLLGTPLEAPLLRLYGVEMGRRVYTETTYLSEFDLVHVGDDAAIGAQTSLQTHLFEDRVMKMSHLHVGAGASVGPRSVVLYDSALEEDVRLEELSLTMKGETLSAGTSWQGIPAQTVE